MEVTNPFEIENEASRYQEYRPKYHRIPFKEIRDFVENDFDDSLDVACGTGHSTVALAEISKRVIGCDLSETMLSEARNSSDIEFVKAKAEDLPFENDSFDFVNISMGFHWVDQSKFLKEVKRVLRSTGLLSIDNYGFLGEISDNKEKQKLHFELFENYLPPASRRSGYPTDQLIDSAQFGLAKKIKYDHKVKLNANQFINLIMTWSNFQILNDERKRVTAEKMKEVYGQIFEESELDLKFGGRTMLYKSTEVTK